MYAFELIVVICCKIVKFGDWAKGGWLVDWFISYWLIKGVSASLTGQTPELRLFLFAPIWPVETPGQGEIMEHRLS